MTLTEQWGKGELSEGKYWIKLNWGDEIIMADYCGGLFELDDHWYDAEEVLEVLAEVPTYKEYQQLLSDQLAKQEGEEIIAELEHENLLLKEELKIAIPKENLRRYLNWIHKRIYQLADENELFKVANAELREQLEIMRGKNGKIEKK